MGNRAYLSIQTAKEDYELLFEANNSLPFFWVGLLDKKIINAVKPIWLEYKQLFKLENEHKIKDFFLKYPTAGLIKINQESFKNNAKSTRLFLEKYEPKCIALFKDFESYIHSKFTLPDQYLLLDIYEISNFTSLNEFLDSLYHNINTIETQNLQEKTYLLRDDLISGGTGFSKAFEGFSTHYLKIIKERPIYMPSLKSNQITTKKSIIPHLIVLAISPIFTYIVYRGYVKDGFSYIVFVLGLINILFYLYSIIRLIQIVKVLKSKKR